MTCTHAHPHTLPACCSANISTFRCLAGSVVAAIAAAIGLLPEGLLPEGQEGTAATAQVDFLLPCRLTNRGGSKRQSRETKQPAATEIALQSHLTSLLFAADTAMDLELHWSGFDRDPSVVNPLAYPPAPAPCPLPPAPLAPWPLWPLAYLGLQLHVPVDRNARRAPPGRASWCIPDRLPLYHPWSTAVCMHQDVTASAARTVSDHPPEPPVRLQPPPPASQRAGDFFNPSELINRPSCFAGHLDPSERQQGRGPAGGNMRCPWAWHAHYLVRS